VSHSDTLALRFKDVTSKQTVPVENEFQPQFSALLAHAAADGHALQQGRCANAHKGNECGQQVFCAPETAVFCVQ